MLLHIVNIVLPVFLIAAVGYALGWWNRRRQLHEADSGDSADQRQLLQQIAFNIAGPVLVFNAILESDVGLNTLGQTVLVAVVMYVTLAALGWLIGTLLQWSDASRRAAVLSLAAKNCGNYGLPIMLFAFGDTGLAIGATFMIAHTLMHMTVGISVAAWKRSRSPLSNLAQFFKTPYLYAIALALVLRTAGIELPTSLGRAVELTGNLWIPLNLLVLGIELAHVRRAGMLGASAMLTAVKLIVPPVVAFGLTELLGIGGVWQAVLVLQSSTPVAINGLLVARQYNVRPDLVATTLLLSTLGSVITVSVLLWLFG